MAGVSLRLSSDWGTRPTRRRSDGGTRSGSTAAAAAAGVGTGSSCASSGRERLAPVMKASTSSRRDRLTLSGLNRSLSADCIHMGDVLMREGPAPRPVVVGSGSAELLRQRGGDAGGAASWWPDSDMGPPLWGLLPRRTSSLGDSSASILRPGLRWFRRWCNRSIEYGPCRTGSHGDVRCWRWMMCHETRPRSSWRLSRHDGISWHGRQWMYLTRRKVPVCTASVPIVRSGFCSSLPCR